MTLTLTYEEALAYLAQFVNYERQRHVPYDPEHFDLTAFAAFLDGLGAPHRAFPSVLIAGSKGKGSTAAMVAAMLSQAGLRTGLFTKPHLVTIRERTQIDRHLISPEDFAALVAELQAALERRGQPPAQRFRTFFELTTALSFLYFARQHVDIAVVEVGLGGRLDATNVLTPQVAVLTPIGLEHTHILGTTLPAIAREKAGIIKHGSRVVSAPQAPEVCQVFAETCRQQAATLQLAGRDFHWQVVEATRQGSRLHFCGRTLQLDDVHVPLLGRHQATNAAVALAVVEELRAQGWTLPEAALRAGLAGVRWEGRLEVLETSPWVVLDAAHTVESAQCLRQALEELFPGAPVHLVLGMAADKNVEGIVAVLAPLAQQVIATRFHSPRACDLQRLAAAVQAQGRPVRLAPDPLSALALARAAAGPGDLVCVTGSLLLIGELKTRLQGLPLEWP
ncbi:MAG: bifunctional folylpolyglutamate synthase/dihydrofolate synthase [Candidatus Tectimicrobiota bacterium]|nr:MAG: bifunctional folylpolyglutamate synthase/dihydrofolate synthase [Candidatus Tectomicrobia bacterium]